MIDLEETFIKYLVTSIKTLQNVLIRKTLGKKVIVPPNLIKKKKEDISYMQQSINISYIFNAILS